MISVKNPLVLIIGNELLVCDRLTDIIKKMSLKAEVVQAELAWEIVEYVAACTEAGIWFDYVFLDGRKMPAKGNIIVYKIRQYMPKAKIILCPVQPEAYPAVSVINPDGVVIEPVSFAAVRKAIGETALIVREENTLPEVRVHTFGNFDVFVDGKPLVFERNKAKELFAYLIDRKGAGASTAEIAAVLWENRVYDRGIRSQTTRTISVLRKALSNNGVGDILVKSWNSLAIATEKIVCDAYAYEKGEAWAVNSYRGEYMNNYSWAEFTNGIMQKNTIQMFKT